MGIGALFDALDARMEALARRERVLLLASVLAACYAVADYLLIQPVTHSREAAVENIKRLQGDLDALRAKTVEVASRAATDPLVGERQRRLRLEAQVRELDADLRRHATGLVPPSQMLPLLRRLLAEHAGLRVARLENLPPTPVGTGPSGTGDRTRPAVGLYRHVLQIEFTGSYLQTLEFLRAAEKLPWRIFWDSLEYEVDAAPQARIRLNIATLSLDEGWIGV